jgi:hypothetical protein
MVSLYVILECHAQIYSYSTLGIHRGLMSPADDGRHLHWRGRTIIASEVLFVSPAVSQTLYDRLLGSFTESRQPKRIQLAAHRQYNDAKSQRGFGKEEACRMQIFSHQVFQKIWHFNLHMVRGAEILK